MKDNSDIPLPSDQIRSKVLVFAITDDTLSQYQQITKGYVELSTDQDENNNTFHYLQVKDEKTNQVLMRSNLKLQNNYGKQKGTIISWTDQQQPQYQDIALSFQKDRQCDMFWRTICQKIGKNYLQINGKDKLQTPNSDNLNYILEKAKNCIDLVDYNIVHSKSVMQGLRQVFYQMKNSHDQMGMGTISRIISAIMSPCYSINAIQTLLSGQNFYLALDVQQYKKGINFRQIYDSKIGSLLNNNKFKLPKQITEKIQISHRATFYRQNVLDLVCQAQLESIMFMICKQAQVQIISYLNRSKFFENLKNQNISGRNLKQNQIQQQTFQVDNKLNSEIKENNAIEIKENNSIQIKGNNPTDKINLIHQSLIMYQHITSQQIKSTYKQNLYTSGIVNFIQNQIENNNIKAIETLFYICQIDKIKFFEYLVQDFKKNSSDNLLKVIMKKFINQTQFRNPILALIQSFATIFNLKRECFDFFNGTFLCSIFALAKDMRSILFLTNILLSQLQNSSLLFNQLIKSKVFEKIVTQYRSGSNLKSKCQELQIIKLLKHIIIEQSYKSIQKNKQIQKIIVDSGYFDICLMIYMKHSQRNNVISSSMRQNFKLIQKMPYSNFDAYLVKQIPQNQSLATILQPIRKKHIEYVNRVVSRDMDEEYLQVQQHAHQQILQNQQQDQYLMKDQGQMRPQILNHIQQNQQKNHLSTQTNDQIKKQSYLEYLKRIINQVKQDDEEFIQSQPRKMIKKTQQNQQNPIIQFTFDLPDMDDLGDTGGQDDT